MAIICTDKIKDQLGNVTAYKLFDTNKNVEKTIPAKVVEQAVASGKLKIEGAGITDDGSVYIPAKPSTVSLDELPEEPIFKQKTDSAKSENKTVVYNEEPSIINNSNGEYVKECLVCGKKFCFTNADLKRNKQYAVSGALSATAALLSSNKSERFGYRHETDRALNKVIDYNRCPSCGSTNLRLIQSPPNTVPPSTVKQASDGSQGLKIGCIAEAALILILALLLHSANSSNTKKDTTIKASQTQIAELQTQVDNLNVSITDMNKQIAARDNEIQDYKSQVSSKDSEIQSYKAQITDKDKQIANLKSKVNSKTSASKSNTDNSQTASSKPAGETKKEILETDANTIVGIYHDGGDQFKYDGKKIKLTGKIKSILDDCIYLDDDDLSSTFGIMCSLNDDLKLNVQSKEYQSYYKVGDYVTIYGKGNAGAFRFYLDDCYKVELKTENDTPIELSAQVLLKNSTKDLAKYHNKVVKISGSVDDIQTYKYKRSGSADGVQTYYYQSIYLNSTDSGYSKDGKDLPFVIYAIVDDTSSYHVGDTVTLTGVMKVYNYAVQIWVGE